MPVRGPNCPDCSQRGAIGRLPMERAYVRRGFEDGSRLFVAIGWYCGFCNGLNVNEEERFDWSKIYQDQKSA